MPGFETLHENLADLDALLNEEAETTDNVPDCLAKIKRAAEAISNTAATLTVADFEDEYEDDNVIDAVPV
jgi:ABC-type transporter Mla subunit MlaD